MVRRVSRPDSDTATGARPEPCALCGGSGIKRAGSWWLDCCPCGAIPAARAVGAIGLDPKTAADLIAQLTRIRARAPQTPTGAPR